MICLLLCDIIRAVYALEPDMTAFPKWREVMARTPPHALSPAVRLTVLKAVHAAYKAYGYKDDYTFYGEKDHWASPAEFATHQAGDCEDFAIAKYYDLMALGFDEADMQPEQVFEEAREVQRFINGRTDERRRSAPGRVSFGD